MESLPLTLESLSSDGVDTAQMSLAQDGISNSLRGAGTILGGRIVRPVLSMVTNTQYTLLGNSIGVLFFGLKAAARGPVMMSSSKFIEGFWCNECTCSHSLCVLSSQAAAGCTDRNGMVNARLIKHALEAGLKEGETAAAASVQASTLAAADPLVTH